MQEGWIYFGNNKNYHVNFDISLLAWLAVGALTAEGKDVIEANEEYERLPAEGPFVPKEPQQPKVPFQDDRDIKQGSCSKTSVFGTASNVTSGYFALARVTAEVTTMSSTEAPRERSLIGLAKPWRKGPKASALPRRWTSL